MGKQAHVVSSLHGYCLDSFIEVMVFYRPGLEDDLPLLTVCSGGIKDFFICVQCVGNRRGEGTDGFSRSCSRFKDKVSFFIKCSLYGAHDDLLVFSWLVGEKLHGMFQGGVCSDCSKTFEWVVECIFYVRGLFIGLSC